MEYFLNNSCTYKRNTNSSKIFFFQKNISFSLYYKVGRIFFFTFAPKYYGTSHYKRKNYAKKPCHCRVSGKSKND